MPTSQYYEKVLQDQRKSMSEAQRMQREGRAWSENDFRIQIKKMQDEIDDIERRWANDPNAVQFGWEIKGSSGILAR